MENKTQFWLHDPTRIVNLLIIGWMPLIITGIKEYFDEKLYSSTHFITLLVIPPICILISSYPPLRRPLVEVSPDEIKFRNPSGFGYKKISVAQIEKVEFPNLDLYYLLHMRDGNFTYLPTAGLSSEQKESLREVLSNLIATK